MYDLDLKRNETLIKEIIVQAQGEVCNLACLHSKLTNIIYRWAWKNTSNRSRRFGPIIH